MLDISKLKKVNPNDPNIKLIVTKNKGIYFWYENATDNIFYIGTGSGETGLYRRIVLQHLNPKQIEYRAKVSS